MSLRYSIVLLFVGFSSVAVSAGPIVPPQSVTFPGPGNPDQSSAFTFANPEFSIDVDIDGVISGGAAVVSGSDSTQFPNFTSNNRPFGSADIELVDGDGVLSGLAIDFSAGPIFNLTGTPGLSFSFPGTATVPGFGTLPINADVEVGLLFSDIRLQQIGIASITDNSVSVLASLLGDYEINVIGSTILVPGFPALTIVDETLSFPVALSETITMQGTTSIVDDELLLIFDTVSLNVPLVFNQTVDVSSGAGTTELDMVFTIGDLESLTLVAPVVVPEPATDVLALIAILGLGVLAVRRRVAHNRESARQA